MSENKTEVIVVPLDTLEKMINRHTRKIEVDLFAGILEWLNKNDNDLKTVIEELEYILRIQIKLK